VCIQFFYDWQDRDDVINDQTFHFLHAMPKGGVLHIHAGASGSLDWLLNQGLYMQGELIAPVYSRLLHCYFVDMKL
jgi:hypothetical protein